MRTTLQRPDSKSGFSLIEVTLSLGIVSFALLLLLGLVPEAIQASSEAVSRTVKTQIFQQVVSDLNSADFADLADESFYFDVDGIPVDTEDESVYEARIDVVSGTTLPGSTAANDNLNRVEILIAHNPKGVRGDDAFDVDQASNPPIRLSTLVSRKTRL